MISGLMGLFAAFFVAQQEPPRDPQPQVRTMTIEQRLILRVPVRPRPRTRPGIVLSERQGPRCLPVGMIRGAYLAGDETIDIVLRNRRLVRAHLDSDCGGLDFWGGFYMQPQDRMICAGRDIIRSRMGATCQIRNFNVLVARVQRQGQR